jgi:glycosyltransferase involved in cell wall biosynthesis
MEPDSSIETLGDMRVAVVHEWVDAYAGSEQVFEAIAGMFPTADLYALSREPGVELDIDSREIHTTFLDAPSLRSRRALTLPLMPLAWRRLRAPSYDLVISSHHAFAHANRLAGPNGIHLCYVHSPARYVWSPEIDERGASPLLRPVRALLKGVDRRAAKGVTAYAANSTAVAQRIQRFWGREAIVIHPPVRVDYFSEPSPMPPTREYVLGFGRWIPYKNLHLVIEAADVAGMPVKIAGRGPDKSRIVEAASRARVPVQLIESPSDDEVRELYRNAACLVFPTVEDFGISPVEAQAAGTPVIAPAAGGALDTIQDGTTGVLVASLEHARVAEAIRACSQLDPEDCRENAESFTRAVADRKLLTWALSSLRQRSDSTSSLRQEVGL